MLADAVSIPAAYASGVTTYDLHKYHCPIQVHKIRNPRAVKYLPVQII